MLSSGGFIPWLVALIEADVEAGPTFVAYTPEFQTTATSNVSRRLAATITERSEKMGNKRAIIEEPPVWNSCADERSPIEREEIRPWVRVGQSRAAKT